MKNAEHPINNLDDIVKSSYKVAVLDSSSTSEFFETSQYETYKKIWNRIESGNTLAKNVEEGVKWVREREEHVFISDGPFLRLIANQPPCDVSVGKCNYQYPKQYTLVSSRNFGKGHRRNLLSFQ